MRVAIVRSDIGTLYLADVESRVKRCFSAEPPGQSLYLKKPSDAVLLAILVGTPLMSRTPAINSGGATLSVRGDETTASVNTSSNSDLKIRLDPTAAFTTVSVTAGAAVAKTVIAADLNTGFVNAGLAVRASVVGTNQIQLDTQIPVAGPTAHLELDTSGGGSTLSVRLDSGWPATPPDLDGLSVAALKAAIWPTSVTVDVSDATLNGLSTWTIMPTAHKATFYTALRYLVAPRLIETGPALLSFVYGQLSKLRSATFRPGGSHVGLPAGIGAAIVADDGVTPFVL
jgi:hypothetical protein